MLRAVEDCNEDANRGNLEGKRLETFSQLIGTHLIRLPRERLSREISVIIGNNPGGPKGFYLVCSLGWFA